MVGRVYFIVLAALFLLLTGNHAFFVRVLEVYPLTIANSGFLISLALVLFCTTLLVVAVFSTLIATRTALVLLSLLTAISSYFSGTFGAVIDSTMIQNVFETDFQEAADLFSWPLITHITLFGLSPLIAFIWLSKSRPGWLTVFRQNAQLAAAAILTIVLCVTSSGDHFASLAREHNSLRYYANPAYPVYSLAKYFGAKFSPTADQPFEKIFLEARIPEHPGRELIIVVVGETARRDRFSLNGYDRETNPLLSREKNIISYSNIEACGTSTAESVPCMFAEAGFEDFDREEAVNSENVLDILQRTGVSVLWRDNNSDSKGVATRVEFQDYRSPGVNTVCDTECRDVGMLEGLQQYIDKQPGDILIVLHQMGNHGPAYYKRYPASEEHFSPACQTPELASCTQQEIDNAYDNAIRYTDKFLSQVIHLLKANPEYQTSMLYVSDHGESLGENGIYLHGLPKMIAPSEQLEVAVIVWASDESDIDLISAQRNHDVANTHDAIFSTLLDLFEVNYQAESVAPPLFALRDP